MPTKGIFTIGAIVAISIVAAVPFLRSSKSEGKGTGQPAIELLNVSYDPTRELWQDVNEQFIQKYERENRRQVDKSSNRTAGPASRRGWSLMASTPTS